MFCAVMMTFAVSSITLHFYFTLNQEVKKKFNGRHINSSVAKTATHNTQMMKTA